MSYYYHTGMGDVLVGILCAVGFFMYTYKGYNKTDNRLGHLCCLFCLGIALFPATSNPLVISDQPLVVDCPAIVGILKKQVCPFIAEVPSPSDYLYGNIHIAFSALLFTTLIYISVFLFTKSDKKSDDLSRKKQQRNWVYRICGFTMAACMVLIIIHSFVSEETTKFLDSIHSFFWLESTSIFAFGISWLTKGQAILKDEV